ncbi:stage III sporulation protein AA [Niallia circulans]|uniref:stage III sporulation protein AA n=1 Tax=Niallia circulans TaxID=1397 RepID=UPI00077CC88C|nr:stage III sporulation protein AA [Niallia circulans]MDR4314446.1 stage III sporulation protein AA [Niallia circulans]MED3839530.1 stage III sporulation protein AA [Niallia circulans]MED4242602.1 stage III sporulation protein AA [Niallia circulans]MED4246580.1 stage III sporulation protein AA [Niallia circulans]PAD86490.1 stage III sporulation protein AA [Niallia circulans]
MNTIYSFLPKAIENHILTIPPSERLGMEEIRVRIGRPLEVFINGRSIFFPFIVSKEDGNQLLNKISQYSVYTMEEELKRGYITIQGGHRIGLAGKVILQDSKVKAIRDVASFNIRIAKEQIGIANPFIPYLYDKGKWRHTMIIGPPQTGKTTLLRDIARLISSEAENSLLKPAKVGIVDERSEIAGCLDGIPQMTFGPRVDVLDACPKAEGMMMMIRSMSPDVLIVDEVGRKEDEEAILEAVNAGIQLIMTTHGSSLEEVKKRPMLSSMIKMGIFERYIELNRRKGPGTVTAIKNGQGQLLMDEMKVE